MWGEEDRPRRRGGPSLTLRPVAAFPATTSAMDWFGDGATMPLHRRPGGVPARTRPWLLFLVLAVLAALVLLQVSSLVSLPSVRHWAPRVFSLLQRSPGDPGGSDAATEESVRSNVLLEKEDAALAARGATPRARDLRDQPATPGTALPRSCANTEQGPWRVTDDRGFTCWVEDLVGLPEAAHGTLWVQEGWQSTRGTQTSRASLASPRAPFVPMSPFAHRATNLGRAERVRLLSVTGGVGFPSVQLRGLQPRLPLLLHVRDLRLLLPRTRTRGPPGRHGRGGDPPGILARAVGL